MYTIICENITPVIDYKTRKVCLLPYSGHPDGCPNFGKKKTCPPKAPMFKDYFDLSKPFYLIINRFNFREHINKMKNKHPEWSDRQTRCCLYWQSSARKYLKIAIKDFLKTHPEYHVTTTPEAMGVDVTKTLKSVGINLEWPPENFTYQVALAGIKRKEK